jgi:hypothetical protein
MFADQPNEQHLDQDLDARRYRNDLLLKSRFESIFEKYSHDFTDIGDEVDLLTGEIVVNNGHLEHMENERDINGALPSLSEDIKPTDVDIETPEAEAEAEADTVHARAKAMFKSIIEDEEDEDGYYNDEAINSVEQYYLETGALSESENTGGDTEEDQAVPDGSDQAEDEPEEIDGTVGSYPSDSECNSLFEAQEMPRSSSPDSLFDQRSDQEGEQSAGLKVGLETSTSNFQPDTGSPMDNSFVSEAGEEDTIIARYGPEVGQEVVAMLQEERSRAQAHIEPAWRIPSNMIPPKLSSSVPRSKTPEPQLLDPQEAVTLITSPENFRSLWAAPRKSRETASRERILKKIRAESEDPLQEGFSSVVERKPKRRRRQSREDSASEYADENNKSVKKDSTTKVEDERVTLMRQGICFYCQGKFAHRAGVVGHWTRLIKHVDKTGENNGQHDLAYLRAYRGKRKVPIRGPRLVVSDFKTMVELHEGAGLTFDEISRSRVLRTRKTGHVLVEVYARYRTRPDLTTNFEEWTTRELRTLAGLCQNPLKDLGAFARDLNWRLDSDIGGKLAEIWLRDLRAASDMPMSAALGPENPVAHSKIDNALGVSHPKVRRESSAEDPHIKAEYSESEDDLFGIGRR